MLLPLAWYGNPAIALLTGTALTARQQDNAPHLRCSNAVMHCRIEATDGDIGRVHSPLVDDETWAIRYIVVDTSNWWLDHQGIAPQWIDEVRWSTKEFPSICPTIGAGRPPYDSVARLTRELEASIYKHYERPGYWAGEAKRDEVESRLDGIVGRHQCASQDRVSDFTKRGPVTRLGDDRRSEP